MKIPFGKPLLNNTERNAVMRVLKSDILTHGKIQYYLKKI